MYKTLNIGNQPQVFEYHQIRNNQPDPNGEPQNPMLNIYVNKPQNAVPENDIRMPNYKKEDNIHNKYDNMINKSFEQDPQKVATKPMAHIEGFNKANVQFNHDFFQDPNKFMKK